MDFLKNAAGSLGGGNNNNNNNQQQGQQGQQGGNPEQQQQGSSSGGGGFLDGIMNKAHGAAGGGPESEKNEDYLDKGIDYVQEKFMGQGAQNNESAVEQAKDEQISDFIRGQYKSTTGKDMPIKDKPTALDRNVD
ncbi:uncharacterized protein RHO25_012459 [Cercospora beticola]|uniref:DNA damage-responsive protein 48 n=1 Tax=Cercospora beticola TaxID=122368 RepID=A0ABZ0P7M3_CERBT|nr:hypothetical protein RHO25_012459 [Cercospora beticola]CAK1368372.1 unnamed protein product [Cercospora beticola]